MVRSMRARRVRGGFTLVEVLLVVVIIGAIAALAVPRLARAFGKSQRELTIANMARLSAAVEEFRADVGRYPTEQEGLKALVEKPAEAANWGGPYLEKKSLPKDGWKREFVFKHESTFGFVIRSLGADGKEGGEGENKDLDNRS